MDSSRKRRTGFIKGKLVKSLYRAAAPIPSTAKRTSSPTYTSDQGFISSPRTVYHLNLHHHQPKEKLVPYNPNNNTIASSFSSDAIGFIVNQEQAAPPQKPKVSFYIPPENTTARGRDANGTTNGTYYAKIDNQYGGVVVDESVDLKAAKYISSVQERFKLERINSERKMSTLQSH